MNKLSNMGEHPTILLHKIDLDKMIFTAFCEKDLKAGDELYCNVNGSLFRGFRVVEILENRQHRGVIENENAFYKFSVTADATYLIEEKEGRIALSTKNRDEAVELWNKPFHIESRLITRCNLGNDIIERLSHGKNTKKNK